MKYKINQYEKLNLLQKWAETDTFTEDRYKQFFHFFPKNCLKVLDLGCSTGRWGAILKKLDKDFIIIGIYIVKSRLEQIPPNIYYQTINCLSTSIPLDDCSVDVVVAGEFIEHLYPIDIDRTFNEIFRILKVGGRLLLTTPNPMDIKRKFRNESILNNHHLSQHYPKTLKLRLQMIGFSKIKIFGSGQVTRFLGYRFPIIHIYGSYLALGDKF